MSSTLLSELSELQQYQYQLADYQSVEPRWCSGCGDHGALRTVQRLCREEQLPPEKTVFVSGIGCSSRFPHYMKTYGFHSLHGRALPVAQGIKMKRPDLHVFVIMGDGDSFSIGTAHWIHALRNNMNLTVIVLDNGIYGLTKNQVSPTSPQGQVSNTSPEGSVLAPLNPLSVTLGIDNASFVAQSVDWLPELTWQVIRQGFAHKGLSFIRILQRCPAYQAHLYDDWIRHPERQLLLHHPQGLPLSDELSRICPNRAEHDPADIHQAREIAAATDPIPLGILYKNPQIPCYEDLQQPDTLCTPEAVSATLNAEFDRFAIGTPETHPAQARSTAQGANP